MARSRDAQESARKKGDLPTLPRFESTYSVIVQRAIEAAKEPRGFTQRVKAATRELAAVVPLTRERYRALSTARKLLTALLLLAVGAGVTYGVVAHRRRPEHLRALARAHLAAGDVVAAKDAVALLRQAGPLGDGDRLELVASVDAGMQKLRAQVQHRLDEQRAAGRFEEALTVLDELERDGFSGEAMLYARADLLRQAGREARARPFFLRYTELYPTSDRADDALYWAAEALAHEGDRAGMRAVLERLLAEYPGTNFKVSARRLLDGAR